MTSLPVDTVAELLERLSELFANRFNVSAKDAELFLKDIISDDNRVKALFAAVKAGDPLKVIDIIETTRVDVNVLNDHDETPLLLALRYYKSLGLVDYLLNKGAAPCDDCYKLARSRGDPILLKLLESNN